MKIGILTHHYVNNFGAFLQTWALQEALKKTFPDDEIFVIDYVNLKHFTIGTAGWFRFRKNEFLKGWWEKIKLPQTFRRERKKWLNLTKRCCTSSAVEKLHLDRIVFGSDEIWNYKDSKGNAKIKFGTGLTGKFAAYAPSIGKTRPNDENIPSYVKDGIKRFDWLSARDDGTEELVLKITGRQPRRVLDPTFLVDFPVAEPQEGAARLRPATLQKPYLLFYYCDGLPESAYQAVRNFADDNGYHVYGAGECNKYFSAVTVNLTPFEWIDMFRNAAYVFTGTFHGAVFSILNRRQFRVYATIESRIRKINSLLSEFSVTDREFLPDSTIALDDAIDYDAVWQIIETKKNASLDYLQQIREICQ